MPGPLFAFYLVFLALFGLVFGSFANVLIWRVPRDESIVSPGSHCPRCGHAIRWYDNIPVISWLLLLRGRCRDCGEPISWRYPSVELASGALWLLAGWRWGVSAQTPLAIVFLYLLLVLSVIDLDTRRLPTPLVGVLGICACLAAIASWATGLSFGPLIGVGGTGLLANPVVIALAGFALGAGISIAVAGLYSLVRGREGLGFGDVRLLGAMGLVLGPYVLLAYVLANLVGALAGLPALLLARRRRRRGTGAADTTPLSIPFGPFLAAAGVATLLWGPAIWAWYLNLIVVR